MEKLLCFPLYVIASVYAFAPRFLRQAMERSLAFAYRKIKLRRKVILENLARAEAARPGWTAPTEQQVYRHLARLTWEIILLFGPVKHYRDRHSVLEGLEHWKAAKERAKGGGVICLSSHLGNWELMAGAGSRDGMDMMIVTKVLKPPFIFKGITRGRENIGVRATYEPQTFKDILRHLKRGGSVGMVIDQYAGPPVGIRVPFFGIPVGTQSAIAFIAKRTGAPVIPAYSYWDEVRDCRVVRMEPALEWITDPDPEQEIALNTAQMSAVVERQIFEHPAEWLWSHRRFKGDLSPLRAGEWTEGRSRK